MHIVDSFPHAVQETETWLRLSDGCRLAVRIWRPTDSDTNPVPAVLEYIPYRKRDFTAERDVRTHPYFAGHGYASVRVDLRGSGESDGVLTDEYLPQELDDGVEVLRWLGEQPWCTGDVGMIGISWGGFNGLQIAARRPPELKAVVTVCSSDDRYADDVHHMGGCLLSDNLSWAATMFDHNSRPPDPLLVGERWREMWLERLEHSGLWLETWLRHQRRDAYWKHGSVCEDFGAIQCPVYAVSGWADGYCNAVFRLLKGLKVPRKGLVGPWAHKYPHSARYDVRPGRWITEPTWPSPNIGARAYKLTFGHDLVPAEREVGANALTIASPLSTGLFAGKWCSYNAPPDLPHDQRDEDGGALCFETARLSEPLEICGQPTVTLDLAADKPVAMVAARLIDVAPDDSATRVSYGLLNLTHRDSDEHPEPLEPGTSYRVTVKLKHIAQRFPAGHSIRLSISTVYWPIAWPAPEPVRLTVHLGESRLTLPVRPERPAEDAAVTPFLHPEAAPPMACTQLRPGQEEWTVRRDLAREVSHLEVLNDEGTFRLEPTDTTISARVLERYSYDHADATSVRGWCEWQRSFARGAWRVSTVTRTQMTCDHTHFYINATLDAYEGDARVFAQNWNVRVPRDLV